MGCHDHFARRAACLHRCSDNHITFREGGVAVLFHFTPFFVGFRDAWLVGGGSVGSRDDCFLTRRRDLHAVFIVGGYRLFFAISGTVFILLAPTGSSEGAGWGVLTILRVPEVNQKSKGGF